MSFTERVEGDVRIVTFAGRDYVNGANAAVLLKCSMATVYRWVRTGRLAAHAVGRRTFFTLADVRALLVPQPLPAQGPRSTLAERVPATPTATFEGDVGFDRPFGKLTVDGLAEALQSLLGGREPDRNTRARVTVELL